MDKFIVWMDAVYRVTSNGKGMTLFQHVREATTEEISSNEVINEG